MQDKAHEALLSIDNVPFAVDETGSFSWQEVQASTLHTVRHASVPSIVIVASVCVDSILGAISHVEEVADPCDLTLLQSIGILCLD